MSKQSSKNHYRGLAAQWYDTLLGKEKKDIEFYKKIVLTSKGKVLELACGTGRLLVPYRNMGADIEGLDISSEMLAICREKLKQHNLTASLYEQDLTRFKTDKQYAAIFIAGGSFQLIDNFEKAMTSLQLIYHHLQSDGFFVLDLFSPWFQFKANTEGQWQLGRTASNEKGEKLLCHSCSEIDIPNQLIKSHFKYELFREDRLIETMLDKFDMRWYGKEEFRLMLEKAGFESITLERRNLITTHEESIVYFAYKG
jgi:ubiquinone/menaquinone biosynthesis C-methylase UbiE